MNLSRPSTNMIGGVASGLARAINIDPTIIRIAFVLLSVLGGGGIAIYLVLWGLIPRESDGGILAQELFTKAKNSISK